MEMKNKYPFITDPVIQNYCNNYSSLQNTLLEKVADISEVTNQTKMLSGPYLGQFLKMMSLIIKPKYVLELGTFTGYGSLAMLSGMDDDAQIFTIEKSTENEKIASYTRLSMGSGFH